MFPSEIHDFGLGCRATRSQFDIGHRQFARHGVRLAYGTDKRHIGMMHQSFFDFSRIDIVAAADNKILLTPGDPQIVILVEIPQVAGSQIGFAVLDRIKPLVPAIVGIGLPLNDARPINADLANFIRSTVFFDVAIIVAFENTRPGIGCRNANRPHLARTIGWVRGDETGRLGHSIALKDRHAQFLLELLEQLGRERRGAAASISQRGNIGIHWVVEQHRSRCGHRHDDRDFPMLNQFPEILPHAIAAIPRRRGLHHMCAGHHHAHPDRIDRHDMEERQRAQHHVVRREQVFSIGPCIEHSTRHAVLCQFRRSGCSAGVEQPADSVLAAFFEGQTVLGLFC